MNFPFDLTKISNREQLLTFLGLTDSSFERVLKFNPAEYEQIIRSKNYSIYRAFPFRRHLIPKRDPAKGKRIVWEAVPVFDREYKATSRRLEAFFSFSNSQYPHPNAYGYIGGRNIRQNATRHLNKRNILKCDIRDFFGSIKTEQISQLFKFYGLKLEISNLMARYLTIGGTLPLGLPTSPIITNILCIGLDDDLTILAKGYNATYTRYADDITLSSNDRLPCIDEIAQLLRCHGFDLAEHKTRRTKMGQSHYVTGLSVSDPIAPHAPRKMKRKLRQELYYCKKFGVEDHFIKLGIKSDKEQQWEVNRIDGTVKYIAHHEPRMAQSIHALWTEIMVKNGKRPSFEPKNFDHAVVSIFGDETEFDLDGKKYLALSLCATQNSDQIHMLLDRILQDHLADPLADGDLGQIMKNGLHFSDATEDLRKKLVEAMQKMPFNAYVSVASMSRAETYKETYLRLLRSLIRRRLIASDGLQASFYVEATSKVSRESIKAVIDSEFQKLKSENNRRPSCFTIETVSKEMIFVALPDFVLGVLRRYLSMKPRSKPDRPTREEILFEYLRDRLVVLMNLDEGTEYSRRKPIRPWIEGSVVK